MGISDDDYEIDAGGHRVLIGLTLDETDEFVRLEERIMIDNPFAALSSDQWRTPDERRWLALFEKHQAALKPFLRVSKTKH